MADLLFTTDLQNATKAELKALVKRVRQEFGKAIDLRTADVTALRQYLQDYLMTQTEPTEDDVIGGTAATVTDAIFSKPEPMLETPGTFNKIVNASLTILTTKGTAHDSQVNTEWLSAILADCCSRAIRPQMVKEKLLLDDGVYYGLAGFSIENAAIFKRFTVSPDEFVDVPEDVKGEVEKTQNLASIIGADGLGELMVYHTIRDNLQYLQKISNISGLCSRAYAIRDKLFSTLSEEGQLSFLDSDRILLKKEAPRIAEYFSLVTDGYNFLKLNDDESSEPLPQDFDLKSHAAKADHIWIFAQSWDWQLHEKGGYRGHHVDRLEPDEITLSLDVWDGKEYNSFLTIVAQHCDPSRRPWLAEQTH